jgi:uncharacterized iron-regulated protein
MIRIALGVLVVAVLGCGGKYPATSTTPPTTATTAMPKGGIAAAALPYHVLDGRTGRQLDEAAFWSRLQQARAICVGEDHPNPHHHWVQLHVVTELGKRLGGGKLALGMEMFQRPFQGVLDDYAAKRIDAAALRSRAGWEQRWGYDWGFYAPTIDAALAVGAQLLALNAARELAKKISRHGLESLTPAERAQLPELKLDDPAHRAWFDALMADMGGAEAHSEPTRHAEKPPTEAGASPHGASPHGAATPVTPKAERIYTVQVLWDETMAELGAKWLAANPTGKLVILAGNGHCHDSAIVGRLERRGVTDVVSVRPVIDAEGEVSRVLAKPMNDFIVVMSMPAEAPAPQ